MDRPTCKTCLYWEPQGIDPDQGYCRRYPPQHIDKTESHTDAAERYLVPVTWGDDWCGEHPDFPAWLARQKESTPRP
jgi:hypothetical protein